MGFSEATRIGEKANERWGRENFALLPRDGATTVAEFRRLTVWLKSGGLGRGEGEESGEKQR